MNNHQVRAAAVAMWAVLLTALALCAPPATAQDIDFERLRERALQYSVIIDMDIEISFGIHTNEQTERYLGTIVRDDGLVIFDATSLAADVGMSTFSGFSVKTSPVKIEITTLDGESFEGEYIGLDRFTTIGFLKIKADDRTFTPVKFRSNRTFRVGDWLGLYMLLPEFITPPLSADVGMISNLITSPEAFPLTVGFNSLEATSVLYNEDLEPVGVLGSLMDPTGAGTDASGMLESFGQFGLPLLGVVTAERLEKLIADPPKEGEVDRGWLGITLQALTSDIAEFWDLDLAGGIIVNDIVRGSPADRAGLDVGDIVYRVNGQAVEIDKDDKIAVFQRMISEMGPGAEVELGVIRRTDVESDTLSLLATLDEAPMAASDAPEYESDSLEFKVRDLVFADYMITGQDPEDLTGVVVSEMQAGGLADVGGLRVGDIVQRIDGTDIATIEDVEAVMNEVEQRQPSEVIFFVWRANKTLFINIKTDW